MIDGSRALVSGAASGLGRELALRLAGLGCELYLVDRDEGGLELTANLIRKVSASGVEILCTDLADPAAATMVLRFAGRVDILVNNAGFGLYGPTVETPWEVERSMLGVHVLTLTELSKRVAAEMMHRAEGGYILNVGSMAGYQPGPLMNVYYASKAYIYSFSRALGYELKGSGIRVSVLMPGLFNTGFASATARNSGAPEKDPKHSTTTVEEVAEAAIRGMLRGRSVIIPGRANRVMAALSGLLPDSMVMAVLARAQRRIRKD